MLSLSAFLSIYVDLLPLFSSPSLAAPCSYGSSALKTNRCYAVVPLTELRSFHHDECLVCFQHGNHYQSGDCVGFKELKMRVKGCAHSCNRCMFLSSAVALGILWERMRDGSQEGVSRGFVQHQQLASSSNVQRQARDKPGTC